MNIWIVLASVLAYAATNPCELALESGICRGYFPSYGYQNGQCITFIYGGCGGNSNRFVTADECEKACGTSKRGVGDPCSAGILTGPCMARIIKWGFERGQCRQYVYGGCRGSANMFHSKSACEARCARRGKRNASRCNQGILTGPCRARKIVWGFEAGRCRQYVYGGCGGSANRFSSQADCERTCGGLRRG